ncbi:unnamed protein product [Durusdinium trenchii]|uniref:Uncharacterized protein n=1 Tax=Durusdinium trenchii TaxID=1381693 RepID=A0ABP0IF73_9DINO
MILVAILLIRCLRSSPQPPKSAEVASDLGIFQELEGFHYSPVERNTCVSIHCFLDKVQEQFACVRHAALLYNAHLVYTNLPLDDMRVLYSYLVAFNGAVSSQKLNKPPFGDDKELKAQQLKIEKLEERYVKVVRFNKILTEEWDRQSFQRFCHELLPECDGAFEEAAAQETAADLQELLRQLAEWRRHGNAAHEDRKVFQQFLDLIFPNDEAIAGLFARPSMGEGAFDLLQTKWMKLEDLHNQSISSINAMAHDQALAQQEDLYAAQRAQLEAEKKIQALQDELAGMAREKAQVLKQKLDGKSTDFVQDLQVASISKDPREQRALEEEKAAAERREREAWQSLDRQREATAGFD